MITNNHNQTNSILKTDTTNNEFGIAANMDNVVTSGGVDTIHCSFYCRFTSIFKDHLRTIARAKRIAENPPDREDAPQPTFECKGNLYVVMPYGFSPNKGLSRYSYFRYVMKDGGITIGIQPRNYTASKEDKNKCPNVRVEIGALPLIIAGSMQTIMEEIEARLHRMGLIIVKNRLGRVDVCADIPMRVRNLQHSIIDRRFITRARSYDMHAIFDDDGWEAEQILPSEFDEDTHKASLHFKGYKCTGFSIGRDKILCRGYDKLEKEKHNEEMLLCLAQRRCDGELWEHMTRIEFQIRREALRGFAVIGVKDGIESWQDFADNQCSIVHYLCTEWLVFTKEEFCRSHSDRIKKDQSAWHPDWLKAVNAFKRAFGESGQNVTRLNASIKRKAREDIAQSLGNGQSALLKTDIELSPYDPVWKEKVAAFQYASTLQYLSDPDKEKAFWRNWNSKELRQECSIPSEALPDLIPINGDVFADKISSSQMAGEEDDSEYFRTDQNLSYISPVASRGAGVTHYSTLSGMLRALMTQPVASGPAPRCIS